MSRKQRPPHRNTRFLYPLVGLLILLAGAYVGGAFYFQDKFLPNTIVNTKNLSQVTLASANTTLAKEIKTDVFDFTENGQLQQKITLQDLGKTVDFKPNLTTILKKQNIWAWPVALFTKSEQKIGDFGITDDEIQTYIDKNLTPALTALNQGRKQTVNAALVMNDGAFSITPEVAGTYLDAKKITTAFTDKIKSGETALDYKDFMTAPTVKKDNPDLTKQLDAAQKVTQVSANYTIDGKTVTLPAETLKSWLTYNDGKVGVNADSVQSYVQSLADEYNKSSDGLNFTSTERGTINFPSDGYKWAIQVGNESEALAKSILSGESFTREPLASSSGEATEEIGKTYIEVDKVNQHMWYYKDGALVLDTPVVTGKPASPTPTGIFSIRYKEANATLRGFNDDGSRYASPVAYWMPIDNTGVGIHDADWQPTFGGTWYQAHGSHGCVNTPHGVMGQLFGDAATSTPVVVF